MCGRHRLQICASGRLWRHGLQIRASDAINLVVGTGRDPSEILINFTGQACPW